MMLEPRPRGRRTWIDKVPIILRLRVDAAIDRQDGSAAGIFRHLNLARFTLPRTFRLYVATRRARIEQRGTGRLFRAEQEGQP